MYISNAKKHRKSNNETIISKLKQYLFEHTNIRIIQYQKAIEYCKAIKKYQFVIFKNLNVFLQKTNVSWDWGVESCRGHGNTIEEWSSNSTASKFGFNGQNKDDEIYGQGNTYSALYWEYDARLGRRWNLDPVDQISISNYACFGNNPIANVDPEGDVVIAAIVGFFKGLLGQKDSNGKFSEGGTSRIGNAFDRAVRDGRNSAKIWGGLFAANAGGAPRETRNSKFEDKKYNNDLSRGVSGGAWQIISRFTWELPQTIIGFSAAHIFNVIGNVDVSYGFGATVLQHRENENRNFSLGSFIHVSQWANVEHEYGHYRQSQQWGITYLGIATASVLSATHWYFHRLPKKDFFHTNWVPNRMHKDRWYEKNMTKKGKILFKEGPILKYDRIFN